MGRFAPSPTGPLHLGSLYTALASYLQARANRGKWLVRIDDLDTPRNVPGAADAILRALDKFGLEWDGDILFQSRKREAYMAALENLKSDNLLYPCTCPRKLLSDYRLNHLESDAREYPGFCRDKPARYGTPHALRIKTDESPIIFDDGLQDRQTCKLAIDHGDFIVRRRDRIIAYQLSVVVDDNDQEISEVVRGFDLLDSTPKQLYLQQKLRYPSPAYLHVPVILDKTGAKLSKQTHAAPADPSNANTLIFLLLGLLKQSPPAALDGAPAKEQLRWAIANWNPAPLKKFRAITL
ncbi:MAG: tRNA glutamyl-Q(34) synthetase GluQRS [Gammaproteobacteria bacterium]